MQQISTTLNRRHFLGGGLAALGAVVLPLPPLRAAENASGLTPLREGVSLLDAGGSNVLIADTPQGLVLVDSGTPAYSQRLMQTVEALHDNGVHTLFNTHWHTEQCGANEAIGNSGATLIAHLKSWQHLSTRYYLPHEQRYHEPLPKAALPTVTFYDKGSVTVGGRQIEYGALIEPHTDADIYVYFRDANVLAVGGAVGGEYDPELDWYGGGWLGGRVNSLDALVALADDDTLIVPAKGGVLRKPALVAERDMTQTLYERARDLIRAGCGADCMLQEGALEGLGRQWQDPQRFLYAVYKGMWAHHYNLAPNIL